MTTSATRSQNMRAHKHAPRPLSSLFCLDLEPFEPPESLLGTFLWRKRMWFETTFGLSVLEPWEKILFLIIFTTITSLVATAFVKFLPHQLAWMYHRTLYYLLGPDATPALPLRQLSLNWTAHYVNADARHALQLTGKL